MTFDLDKAKEDCQRHEDALEEAQSCMCGHCHECGFDPSEMKAALDEIERQAARIRELEAQNQDLMANCNDLRERCWKAEGKIGCGDKDGN